MKPKPQVESSDRRQQIHVIDYTVEDFTQTEAVRLILAVMYIRSQIICALLNTEELMSLLVARDSNSSRRE